MITNVIDRHSVPRYLPHNMDCQRPRHHVKEWHKRHHKNVYGLVLPFCARHTHAGQGWSSTFIVTAYKNDHRHHRRIDLGLREWSWTVWREKEVKEGERTFINQWRWNVHKNFSWWRSIHTVHEQTVQNNTSHEQTVQNNTSHEQTVINKFNSQQAKGISVSTPSQYVPAEQDHHRSTVPRARMIANVRIVIRQAYKRIMHVIAIL